MKHKRFLFIFFFLVILFSGIYISPKLLSHNKIGEATLIFLTKKLSNNSLTIQDISLSWNKKQTVKNITIKGNWGSFHANEIETSPLFTQIFKPKNLSIKINNWNLNVTYNKSTDSPFHIQESLLLKKLKKLILEGDFISNNGDISFKVLNETDNSIIDYSLYDFSLEKHKTSILSKALTSINSLEGEFLFEAISSNPNSVKGQFINFPTIFLSPILSNGLLNLLGTNLNGFIKTSYQDKPEFLLSLKGDDLLAFIEAEIENSQIIIKKGHTSYVLFKNEFFNRNFSFFKLPANINSEELKIFLTKGSIPLSFKFFTKADLDFSCYLPQISFDHSFSKNKDENSFSLKNISGVGKYNNQVIDLELKGSQFFNKQTFPLVFSLTSKIKEEKLIFSFEQPKIPFGSIFLFEKTKIFKALPFSNDFFSLKTSGEITNNYLELEAFITNDSFSSNLSLSGPFSNLSLSNKGLFHIPKIIPNSNNLTFKEVNFDISGSQITLKNNVILFSKLIGKFHSEGNELSLHAKKKDDFSYNKSFLENVSMVATLDSDLIDAQIFSPWISDFNFQNANIFLHFDGENISGNAKFNVVSKTIMSNETSFQKNENNNSLTSLKIKCSKVLEHGTFSLKDKPIFINGDIVNVRTKALDFLIFKKSNNIDLENLLGTLFQGSFSSKFTINSFIPETLKVDLSNEFSNLSLNLLSNTGQSFTRDSKFTGTWQITPETFRKLFKGRIVEDYSLKRKIHQEISFHFLDKEIKTDNPDFFSLIFNHGIEGHLNSGDLLFQKKENGETFLISKITGTLSSRNIGESIFTSLKGECYSSSQKTKNNGTFFISSHFDDIWNQNRFLNKNYLLRGEAKFLDIPSSTFPFFLSLSEKTEENLSSLLDPVSNVEINWNLENHFGPINIYVKSELLKLTMPLIFSSKEISLSDPLEASLNIIKKSDNKLIDNLNSYLGTKLYFEQPLTFIAYPKGFSLSLKEPFSMNSLEIKKAKLDFGKVTLLNGEEIEKTLIFLKVHEHPEFIETWFTPLHFNLHQGNLFFSRFDFLLMEKIHLASWGKINLNNNRVNMTLGVSPETLKTYYNISVPLSSKDFLQVKLTGNISNLEADWSSAYSQIGALLSNIASAGGRPTSFLKKMIDNFFSSLNTSTPSPTTTPFPWEKLTSTKSLEKTKEKKKASRNK